MVGLIGTWEEVGDRRTAFLSCYHMMTSNMIRAAHAGEFRDGPWVESLTVRFADYYFDALKAFERDPDGVLPVWRCAHEACADDAFVLQLLLLGINAHINYDLVLALVDVLEPEWAMLDAARRRDRHADYLYVNDVIARTVDAVQDEVVEVDAPRLDLVDRLLGPLDEWLISSLLTHWRDEVWSFALEMLSAGDARAREAVRVQVERLALRRADAILLRSGATELVSLF